MNVRSDEPRLKKSANYERFMTIHDTSFRIQF